MKCKISINLNASLFLDTKSADNLYKQDNINIEYNTTCIFTSKQKYSNKRYVLLSAL